VVAAGRVTGSGDCREVNCPKPANLRLARWRWSLLSSAPALLRLPIPQDGFRPGVWRPVSCWLRWRRRPVRRHRP